MQQLHEDCCMMTDCVGIANIAIRLCSGVFGMCQDCQGIARLLLALFYRIARAGMHEPVDWCPWSIVMHLNTILNIIGNRSMRFQD